MKEFEASLQCAGCYVYGKEKCWTHRVRYHTYNFVAWLIARCFPSKVPVDIV